MLGVAREHLLDEDEDHRAEDRPDEGADAAHDHHHEPLAGEDPEHDLRRGEAPEGREQRPGEAGEHGGDDEDHQLEGAWIAPEAREAALVLADGLQRATERGTDDGAADHEREHHAGSYQEIERVRRGQARPAPEQRGLGHPRDAVGAAGQVAPLVGHRVEQLGEGQRQHREVDAGGTRGEPSDGEGDHAREQRAREQRHRHRLGEVDQHQRARVGAEAEVGGMAERDHARVAHDEIERQGEQAVDEEIGEKGELVTRGHPGNDGQRHQGDRRQRARPPHSSSPKRPQGRKMRIAPITAYMITMAVSGR